MQNKPTIDPDKQQDLLQAEFQRGYLAGRNDQEWEDEKAHIQKEQKLTVEQQIRMKTLELALDPAIDNPKFESYGRKLELAKFFAKFIADGEMPK